MTEAAGNQLIEAEQSLRLVRAADGPPLLDGRMLLKVSADESHDAYTLCLGLTPPGLGPPLHLHMHDDQTHYVVRGTYELIVGSDVVLGGPGASVHMPRYTPHTFRNVSDEPAEIIEFTAPGGIDRYFDAVAHLGPVAMDIDARNAIGRPFGMSFPLDPKHYPELPPGEVRRQATFVLADEGCPLDWEGCDAVRKVGADDTAGSHALTEISLSVGSRATLPELEQAVVVVLSGTVVVEAGDERAQAIPGDSVAVLSSKIVTLTAGDEPAKLVVYTIEDAG